MLPKFTGAYMVKDPKLFNPLNDYLFYMIMSETEGNVPLLSFLNAVLNRNGNDKIISIEKIESRFLPPEEIGNKGCVLDVRARLHDQTQVNIELQVKNEGNMAKRSLFYGGRLISGGLNKGDDYKQLSKLILINIVNFNLFDSRKFHNVFHLREDEEHELILTDALEIHTIDMVQFNREQQTAVDPLHRWLIWLDKVKKPELAREVVDMDAGIAAAEARLEELLRGKEFTYYYEMREKAERDYINGMTFAHEEGLAEGISQGLAEGLSQGISQIARNMKSLNLPVEVIIKATGLSSEEITKL
jgi:predicted transposase/invertase (TIGR01784 family)